MDYNKVAKEVISYVGGPKNIKKAFHCAACIYNNSDTTEIISNKEIDMTAYQLKDIDLEPAK